MRSIGDMENNKKEKVEEDLESSERPSVKLESLLKTLGVKLKSADDFEVWKKAIIDIGMYRRWPESFTKNHKPEDLQLVRVNKDVVAREEGYFVMKNTVAAEYHYLFDTINCRRFEEIWRVVCVKFGKYESARGENESHLDSLTITR